MVSGLRVDKSRNRSCGVFGFTSAHLLGTATTSPFSLHVPASSCLHLTRSCVSARSVYAFKVSGSPGSRCASAVSCSAVWHSSCGNATFPLGRTSSTPRSS